MSKEIAVTKTQELVSFDTSLAADLDPADFADLTVGDLDRIDVKNGAYVLRGDSGQEERVQEFDGVIVHSHNASVLWLSDDDDSSPAAYSNDGLTQVVTEDGRKLAAELGLPVPLEDMEACPYNQFGSVEILGKQGRGKATKNMRRLYIWREGLVLPEILNVSPTGLREERNYRIKGASRFGGYSKVVTHFTLEAQKAGTREWSIPGYSVAGKLDPATQAQADMYRHLVEKIGSTPKPPVVAEATVVTEESEEFPF